MNRTNNSDTSNQLLIQAITSLPDIKKNKGLWLIDENITLDALDCFPDSFADNLTFLSNRFDLIETLKRLGFRNSMCNDFEFTTQDFSYVFLRASKEKALCFHLIHLAIKSLEPNGSFIFSCGKKEGLKSYLNYIDEHIDANIEVILKEKTSQCLRISDVNIKKPFENNYHDYSAIDSSNCIYSKPGQFGWKKIDQGSRLLSSHFNTIYEGFDHPPKQVLDLGCGYGYLILNTAQFTIERWATDNNVTALNTCKKNCEAHELECTTVLDDAASNIKQSFDWIICNPPFHHGFKTSPELLIKFLTQTKRLLNKQGKASFVTNQFIPLEREAKKLFSNVDLIDQKNGFNIHIISH